MYVCMSVCPKFTLLAEPLSRAESAGRGRRLFQWPPLSLICCSSKSLDESYQFLCLDKPVIQVRTGPHMCSSLNCWWFYAPMLLITFNNMANFSWLDFDKSVRAAVINQRFRWAGICRFLLLKKSNFTRKNWGCRVFCTNKFCSRHYYCKQEMLLHARNRNFCHWRFSCQIKGKQFPQDKISKVEVVGRAFRFLFLHFQLGREKVGLQAGYPKL